MAVCTLCTAPAIAQWTRRPNDAELGAYVAAEQSKRDAVAVLADPAKPAPTSPPLPTSADTTIAIYACVDHAVTMDLAALVHSAACTAPSAANLPNCDCTPETLPLVASADVAPAMPVGW